MRKGVFSVKISKKIAFLAISGALVGFLTLSGFLFRIDPEFIYQGEKIKGISVAASPWPLDSSWVNPICGINANWVTLLPFGLIKPGESEVIYNVKDQYWGEKPEGIVATTRHAQAAGLKVMYKPMVWIPGSWPGDFNPGSEKRWQTWENSYEKMLLTLAVIADSMDVEMICIGTEFRASIQHRTEFWRNLIQKIRRVYHGKLTYAANWDDFWEFPLWSQFDYIGIDAYFPLNSARTPSLEELRQDWHAPLKALDYYARYMQKPILFTEYGYKSIHHTAWKQWEFEQVGTHQQVNLEAQYNAYQAVYEGVWRKPWFAGGFIWKWQPHHEQAGGNQNSDYTPQGKPAEQLIRTWYARH